MSTDLTTENGELPTSSSNVQQAVPFFWVSNIEASLHFYVDGLGFNVDWEHRFEPGLPVFAQLTRDGLSLFLTEHAGDCQVGGAAYFVVDDVDAGGKRLACRKEVFTPRSTRASRRPS